MLEVQLLDPNGYNVPLARLPITTPAEAPAARHTLLTVEAPRHAAESGVGYNPRHYTTRTQPAPLPTAPDRLADLLLTPGADANQIGQQLAAQEGDRPARRLLAAAHDIAADRLFATA